MEQVKIAITQQDNSLTIMSIVLNDGNGINRKFTNELVIDEIEKSRINSKSWRIITDADLIKDREFRDAWKDENNKIDIDIEKAKNIHIDNLRIKRADLLSKLDIEYIKADENNDITKRNEIIQRKNILRDITKDPRIDAATNIEELKKVKVE